MGRTKKSEKLTGKQLYRTTLEWYYAHDMKNKEGERLCHIRKDGNGRIIGQLGKAVKHTCPMHAADITKMKFTCKPKGK